MSRRKKPEAIATIAAAADVMRIVQKLYDQPDPLGVDAILEKVTIQTCDRRTPRAGVVAIFEVLLANLPADVVVLLHAAAIHEENYLDKMRAEWAKEDRAARRRGARTQKAA